jgi:hypothetical protein
VFQASPLRPLVPGAIENMAGLSQIRLEVWPQRTVVTNLKVRLRKTHQPAGNTLRVARSTGLVYPDSQIWTFAWPTNTPATLYVSPQYARPLATNDWPVYFDLEAQIVDLATNVVFSDTIRLTVAPMILPPECNPPQAIYSTLDLPVGVGSIQADEHAQITFAQDMVKFVKYQTTYNQNNNLFIDLNHPLKEDFTENLRTEYGWNGGTHVWPASQGGNGGNIMATPPLPDAPYGKLMIGSTLTNHVNQKPFWAGQGVQPVVDIETAWLAVGHVDEIFMWVATNKVLYADPWLAADLLHEQIAAGGATNGLWFGKNVDGTDGTVRAAVIAKDEEGNWKIATLPSPLPDSTNSVDIVFAAPNFATNDILRVNSELLKVTATSGATVTVARAQAGRPPMAHTNGSVIYAYSPVMLQNFPLGPNPELSPVAMIQSATNEIAAALGDYASSVDFIPMPVLFMHAVIPFPGHSPRAGYIAATPNVVNGLVDANDVYHYCYTGNLGFHEYILNVLPDPRAYPLWLLHIKYGNLHCATAAIRELPAAPPWWETVKNWE